MFASEDQQIQTILEAESANAPFAFSVPQEAIDQILRWGSNTDQHRMLIAMDFMKQKSEEQITDHLRKIYHGGNGLTVAGVKYAAWYDMDGLRVTVGTSAQYVDRAQRISWEDATHRLRDLMDAGQFATPLELAEAPAYERHQAAETLLYLRQNLSEEAVAQGFLPSLVKFQGNNFPEETAHLSEHLANADFREMLDDELITFRNALQRDRSLLRFRHPTVENVLTRTEELMLPHLDYSSNLTEIPEVEAFITEDEINDCLARGSNVEASKKRIWEYWQQHRTSKEQADFLKNEYGIGGRSHALSRSSHSDEGHDSKGMHLKKQGCPDVHLTWSQVAKRMDELIRRDRFFTQDALEDINPIHIREALAERGIVNGQVVDENALNNSPFIQQVMADVERLSQEDTPLAPDLSGQPVTRQGDTITIEADQATHESDITVSDEQQEQVAAVPEAAPVPTIGPNLDTRDPLAPAYQVGDTVYLDDTAFEITSIGRIEVQLLDPTLLYPVFRVENKNRFENLLKQDSRNDPVTEFLTKDVDSINDDLREVLTSGLFTDQDKDAICGWFRSGEGNTHVAQQLSNMYAGRAETMEFITGESVDYITSTVSIELEIQDKFNTKVTASWDEVAAILRTLYQQELDGFSHEQPQRETVHLEGQPAAQNFRITDTHLGEGGPKAKYRMNIEAIRTLQQIEAEGRTATPEEQEILSRYVGWGGIPDAFDDSKPEWSKEYAELKGLLTPQEYDMARASTLNAHYTSPTVIRAIYGAVQQMGFRTGNILEPSCGVGNFFGILPYEMQDSRLYGVELDSLTGRIAQQLYPKAHIEIKGFEKTDRKDFFDLAVGNIPFGSYTLNDRKFNQHHFLIHDYFFAKTLDQVRPGGIIAFITSKGTMDKQSPEVRRYIAQRAELLGAIRLPNTAFKANAGTEVTSDILFLQKRERLIDIEPAWVHLGLTRDGIPINSYFVEHPEMVLGRMAWDERMYGNEKETACLPIEGANLAVQLGAAMQHIRGTYQEAELPDLGENEAIDDTLPADPGVKNYSYTVVDGEVYYRENSRMVRPALNQATKARIKALVALRNCVSDLIQAQMDEASDDAIHTQQQHLDSLYDDFTRQFGRINSRANAQAYADDSSYYLLCSLEVLDSQGQFQRKADMFTKRTIRQHRAVEHVDTASEALAVSIGERACVDLPFMSKLTGKEEKEIAHDLVGIIFPLPESVQENAPLRYVTADEYLSGNVRRKLRDAKQAAEKDAQFAANVTALEAAQPKDLTASEIDVRLGATWVGKSYIQQFMEDLLSPPAYFRRQIQVNFSPHTAEWGISGKSLIPTNNIAAYTTYGTSCANAYRILEDTLNLRDVRVYDVVVDAEGKEKRVLNQKETTLAQQKQQAIKDAFQDWIWKDPDRRHVLTATYNELFNSTRPRTYDGSHISFGGMNPEITLREHQRNAIAHILYGGNTLLAHVVGAGKTFEMVAACMESKRLGLCQKAMFVVPNHLTEQWGSEFLRLYPSANILVTTKKDFEKAHRKKFCARIATGDYDAIIIGHSQFERIPVSRERQERLLQEQLDEIMEGIEELKYRQGERFSVKALERSRKQLEGKLQKLQAEEKKDDVVTFEQLGVDRLFVDEVQAYKNLFLTTKMRNVAGLSTSEAQKSSDMFAKCRYLDEITGGRGIVFATGTPVSNSMTELYVRP